MKRSSIGLAALSAFGTVGALALAGQAHAQSNVTIYGIVDAGVEYVNHASDNGGAARAISGGKNTSRFGFKGTEDLGGDLKAVFNLESGINMVNGQFDDGPGAIFDRRATLGLQHKQWGQVTIGRTFTTTYDYMLQFDPMGYAPNYSWATSATATGGRKDGLFSRSSNAVRYDGEFSGLKLGAMYGFGNVPGSMKTASKYDFAIGYENGPVALVATFDRQNGAGGSVAPADTTDYIQGIHAGASYRFGGAKVMAGYRNYKKTFVTASTATLRSDMYWLGMSYDFTPAFTLYGAVYHQDIKDASDADPTLISLRAQYAMSKRTALYLSGGYAFAKHGQKVSLSRDLTGAADTQIGVTAGIQHRF